jgi:hypothetical protein
MSAENQEFNDEEFQKIKNATINEIIPKLIDKPEVWTRAKLKQHIKSIAKGTREVYKKDLTSEQYDKFNHEVYYAFLNQQGKTYKDLRIPITPTEDLDYIKAALRAEIVLQDCDIKQQHEIDEAIRIYILSVGKKANKYCERRTREILTKIIVGQWETYLSKRQPQIDLESNTFELEVNEKTQNEVLQRLRNNLTPKSYTQYVYKRVKSAKELTVEQLKKLTELVKNKATTPPKHEKEGESDGNENPEENANKSNTQWDFTLSQQSLETQYEDWEDPTGSTNPKSQVKIITTEEEKNIEEIAKQIADATKETTTKSTKPTTSTTATRTR